MGTYRWSSKKLYNGLKLIFITNNKIGHAYKSCVMFQGHKQAISLLFVSINNIFVRILFSSEISFALSKFPFVFRLMMDISIMNSSMNANDVE